MMKTKTKTILFVLLSIVCSSLHVLAQGPEISGFISIDCGSERNYTDVITTIPYITDAGFTEFGKNANVSTSYLSLVPTLQSINLRVFPNGTRNCYTLRPEEGKNKAYLIRAFFDYGNYDAESQPPVFDVYIDTNLLVRVNLSESTYEEIVYVPTRDYIHVCLVNTGDGAPLISALELRLLGDSTYTLTSGAMRNYARLNIGSQNSYRHPEDEHDRIWSGQVFKSWLSTNTTNKTAINTIRSNNNAFDVPAEVLATAQKAVNSSIILVLQWPSPVAETRWIVYLHFTEVEIISNPNRTRAINVSIADNFLTTVKPEYLKPVAVGGEPFSGAPAMNISISAASTANLPVFINALEIYQVLDLSNSMTDLDDLNAIIAIKATYKLLKESWQGDPCLPVKYTWTGLNCTEARIFSLNLSSSGLSGSISPSFSDLIELETLDLSNNQLSGGLPEFFAGMTNLKNLNLSGNNLTGLIPEALKKRVVDGKLKLSLDGNPLCETDTCNPSLTPKTTPSPTPSPSIKDKNEGGKKKSGIIPVVVAVVSAFALAMI